VFCCVEGHELLKAHVAVSAPPPREQVREADGDRTTRRTVSPTSGDAPTPEDTSGSAQRAAERDRDAAEASRDRFAFMAEVSRCLGNSLQYETTLTTVAGMSLPYLGAWCIVDLCTEDDGIRRLAVLHPDPGKQALARELHERFPPRMDDALGAARVIRTSRPDIVVGVADDALPAVARDAEHLALLRELGIGAYVIVPMVARGRTLGAMTFVTAESGRRFGEIDVTLAEDLARRAAMAVDNARLHAEALDARREAESARARAEEAQRLAEAASRAKGEFLAVMSHELRTPLNAITGYVQLMELGLRGPVTPEQQVDLARIQRSQRHLMSLINGVLNYSRVEAGAIQYAIADVSVAEALATCEALVMPHVRAKKVELSLAGCDAKLTMRADPDKVQQIILNLLTNAVKFTDPGGRIAMGCGSARKMTAITVTDTGEGIAADQLERIFEPFVQVDSRLNRKHEGVGLGLAISRDLARGMGGDLTVASTPGEGSTFTLVLPRA
jgi:signal transduction histidine kinase